MESGGMSALDRFLLVLFALIFYLLVRFLQQTQDDLSMLARTMDDRVTRCEVKLNNLGKLEETP